MDSLNNIKPTPTTNSTSQGTVSEKLKTSSTLSKLLIATFSLEILCIALGVISGGYDIWAYIMGYVLISSVFMFILMFIASSYKLSILEKIIYGLNLAQVAYYIGTARGFFENDSTIIIFNAVFIIAILLFVFGLFDRYRKLFMFSALIAVIGGFACFGWDSLYSDISFSREVYLREKPENDIENLHTERRLGKNELESANFNKITREYTFTDSGKKIIIPAGYFLIDEEQYNYKYPPGNGGIFYNGETELWVIYQGVANVKHDIYRECETGTLIFEHFDPNYKRWRVPTIDAWNSVQGNVDVTTDLCVNIKNNYKESEINGYKLVQNKEVNSDIYSISFQTNDKSNYQFFIIKPDKTQLDSSVKDVLEKLVADFTENGLQESDRPIETPTVETSLTVTATP